MTRPRIAVAILAVILAVIVLGFLWQLLYGPGWPRPGDPRDTEQVALGEMVYMTHCASCHGVDLEGQPNWRERLPSGRLPAPPHDADGHTWHHPDDQLFAMIRDGIEPFAPPGYESDMPAYADILGDREIWAVLAYIKSHWPDRIRQHQERITEEVRGWNRSDGP